MTTYTHTNTKTHWAGENKEKNRQEERFQKHKDNILEKKWQDEKIDKEPPNTK